MHFLDSVFFRLAKPLSFLLMRFFSECFSNSVLPFRLQSLRRMDSTKRIKKEIRLKRSSFLGIEGNDDESYLEPGMSLH